MKLSCQEGMVPGGSLSEKLDNLARYGFDAIELGGAKLWEREKEVVKALEGSLIKVSTICIGMRGCLLSSEKTERDLAVADLKRLLELAAHFGAVGVIVVPIFGSPQIPDLSPLNDAVGLERDLLVEILHDVTEHAEKVGSVILLEPLNRYETHFMNRLEQAVEICQRLNSSGTQIMADFFHMNIEEADIPAAIEKAGKYIYHVHLADSNRLVPGYGHTGFKAGFAALKKVGFDKYMALECGIPGDPEIELPRCVQFLKAQMSD